MALDKEWIKEHKKEVIMGGVMTALSVAGIVYMYGQHAQIDSLKCQTAITSQNNDTLMVAD